MKLDPAHLAKPTKISVQIFKTLIYALMIKSKGKATLLKTMNGIDIDWNINKL